MMTKEPSNQIPFFDVIIIGAGLSGIGAAYHIQHDCPGRSYAILEGRDKIGGTWDLFKYPGIRSDSDMYTLGYPFYPWKDPKAIADGPAILEYINETARTFDIYKNIRFHHKAIHAEWSTANHTWTIRIAPHENVKEEIIQCNFLFACSGYYNYEEGYLPEFKNMNLFKGITIHPQQWDTSLDYENKRVVVIGSGATAITIVPEMAKKAKEVVMLQRSPTYIVNLPSKDVVANFFKKIFPKQMAHSMSKWKNVLFGIVFFTLCKKWPKTIKKYLQKNIQKELGDRFELTHFDPSYNPWDQRLCMIPDSDFFNAMKEGKARIITDTIDSFSPTGLKLGSGSELEADIIVTATGLKMQLLGGMVLHIDGVPVKVGDTHCYKGVMFSNIPNFAISIGYTNASWTLKCDLNCTFVTRVLNFMAKHHYKSCKPVFDSIHFQSEDLLNLNSGYIQRAKEDLPKQGSKSPWKVYQNYIKDLFAMKYSRVKDKYLQYE